MARVKVLRRLTREDILLPQAATIAVLSFSNKLGNITLTLAAAKQVKVYKTEKAGRYVNK